LLELEKLNGTGYLLIGNTIREIFSLLFWRIIKFQKIMGKYLQLKVAQISIFFGFLISFLKWIFKLLISLKN
jgi:hypothetical protein